MLVRNDRGSAHAFVCVCLKAACKNVSSLVAFGLCVNTQGNVFLRGLWQVQNKKMDFHKDIIQN